MRLNIIAAGRLKSGPERELCARYTERLKPLAPKTGLSFTGVTEFAESRQARAAARMAEEAKFFAAALPDGAALIALDERGKSVSSETFAAWIGARRDEGRKALALVIGGPDGLDESLRSAAAMVLSFGAMTLPHQIARVLALEQLYRAVTILSGHPYHRGS